MLFARLLHRPWGQWGNRFTGYCLEFEFANIDGFVTKLGKFILLLLVLLCCYDSATSRGTGKTRMVNSALNWQFSKCFCHQAVTRLYHQAITRAFRSVANNQDNLQLCRTSCVSAGQAATILGKSNGFVRKVTTVESKIQPYETRVPIQKEMLLTLQDKLWSLGGVEHLLFMNLRRDLRRWLMVMSNYLVGKLWSCMVLPYFPVIRLGPCIQTLFVFFSSK